MFFDNIEKIPELAEEAGFSIFIVNEGLIELKDPTKKAIKTNNKTIISFPNDSIFIEPDEKGKIGVEQIRAIEEKMQTKQIKSKFIIIKKAELINQSAENAALKLLEEPKENYHLVFFAKSLNYFLPTIISRASVYVFKNESPLDQPPLVDDEIKALAKEIITVKPINLGSLVEELTGKKRKNPRQDTLVALNIAIELLYKSYFKTNNKNLLNKLPNLIKAYENIKANGNIKLQLWSNLC